jgi:hypothetical protein
MSSTDVVPRSRGLGHQGVRVRQARALNLNGMNRWRLPSAFPKNVLSRLQDHHGV